MPDPMVPLPTGDDIAAFLGRQPDPAFSARAAEFITITVALARSHTRGVGFESGQVAEDIAAVIVMAAARLVGNPEQDKRVQFGDFNVVPQTSWSLVERAVLDRYRRRAQ